MLSLCGGGGVGGGVHSHYIVKPNLVLRLGWGFDKISHCHFFIDFLILNPIYLPPNCQAPLAVKDEDVPIFFQISFLNFLKVAVWV